MSHPRSTVPAQTHIAVCEHCDQICTVPALARGEAAHCPRCGLALERYGWLGPREMLAVCLAAIVVFMLANAYPLVTLEVQGLSRHASLLEAIAVTWQQPGLWGVALMALLTAFVLPLAQLLLLLALLLMLLRPRLPAGFDGATRALRLFRPWSMVPVFVLGVLVAIIKIADLAQIIVGVGLWSMAALVVLLTLLSRLDSRMLWRFAETTGAAEPGAAALARPGSTNAPSASAAMLACEVCGRVHAADANGGPSHCARCHAAMHRRKPDSLSRTWAFMVTGLLLYIPANVLPIMRTTTLFDSSEHTILGGVVQLWEGGAPDIAIIVFVASIAVPLVKFIVLTMLLLAAHHVQNEARIASGTAPRPPASGRFGGRFGRLSQLWSGMLSAARGGDSLDDHRTRARLYRFIEFIGQWSMLDVFVVLLLAALVNFQGLMQVTAGLGAIAFGLTVALTMLAAMSFDPRLIWDGYAGEEAVQARPDVAQDGPPVQEAGA